ncbi:solute carrier family 22 member 6-A-like [Argopecten irradians]|uniref:solute carrier family 22 member 6-A-like n=1 Tax=Argopecten irradians TaxID=31199 RepID=UPI00371BD355
MRFIIGFFQQGLAMARPALMLELFPAEARYLTELSALGWWTTASLLITPIVYFLKELSWRYLYLIFTLISTYSIFGYWIYDESVRWLLANGRTNEAKRILRKAAKMNKIDEKGILDVVEEILATGLNTKNYDSNASEEETKRLPEEPIHSSYQRDNIPPKYTLFTLFKRRRIAIITTIMITVWTVDSLVYYGLILSSASLPVDRYLSFFLLTVAEYPVVLFEYSLMNRIGRKRFCILFHTIAAVSLIAGTVANYFSDLRGANEALMLFFFLGKLGITGSFSCLFLYTPEIYPTNLRTIGIGLSSAAGRVGGMLAPFAGPLAEQVRWAPGAIFGCLCLLIILILPQLPETKGHELPTLVEDLEEWYKVHNRTEKQKEKDNNYESG